MKEAAEALETRNALLLTLRDHDRDLKAFGKEPGRDRESIVEMLRDMNCKPWEFGDEPWVR